MIASSFPSLLISLSAEEVITFLIMLCDLQVVFLSETRLVAGGFDCNPMLFGCDKDGVWYVNMKRQFSK